MSEYSKLAQLMRNDWDRRVSHDYRFWMSDGYASDEAMWAAGERDLKILTAGLGNTYAQTMLEVGCGVGRILKPALGVFGRVIGVDVSEKAINKARELLGNNPRAQLIHGNGFDLGTIATESVDVVISYAAVCSIPTEVVANYLREMWRVLKLEGKARIQLYLGKEQEVDREDTLHLRCYNRENATNALIGAGFDIEGMQELVLPTLQVSFKEMGIEAVIVSLKRASRKPLDASTISNLLLPRGEKTTQTETTVGQDLEYWMSVNYASELAERGESDQARKTLEYAAAVSKTTAIDVSDLLGRIVKKIDGAQPTAMPSMANSPTTLTTAAGVFEKNLRILSERFPNLTLQVQQFRALANHPTLEIRETPQGPAFFQQGQCLDHAEKPVSAAQVWAKKLLQEERYRKSSHLIVVGLGAGHHIDAMIAALRDAQINSHLSVFEPNLEVFVRALELRDQSAWLSIVQEVEIGEQPQLPKRSADYELIIRPQTQAVASQFCGELRACFYGARGLSLLHPTIAVVGPMQGGGLPMVEYSSRALLSLYQRQREFDLSGFYGSFQNLERFIREPLRRKNSESNFCEVVSQVVLDSITERPVDIVVCLALAPLTPRALMELRARGIITVLWFVEDYVRFTYWQDIAKHFDFVFTIQKGKCIDAIRAAGAGEVHYLPVACDPVVHAPLDLSAEEKTRFGSPLSFMGAGYHNRQQLFASFADMPLKIWGTEWPGCKPFDRMVQEGGRRISPNEYVKIFNASDININLHSSHERDGVDPFGDFLNPRTFELASAGAFQLVDKRSLLSEAFEEGKEIITFQNAPDLKEKVGYYLAHPEERRSIARRARERALNEHTYGHRFQKMLSIIYSSRYEHIKAREESSPWKRMLTRAKRHPELQERCERAFHRGEEANLDGLVSDIITGQGKLSETEQKLLFLYHVKKQIIRMQREEGGG